MTEAISSLQQGTRCKILGYNKNYQEKKNFTIDNKQYELVNECACFSEECLNYFPHPADASNDYWYLIRNAETKKFSGGHYTKFNFNPFPTQQRFFVKIEGISEVLTSAPHIMRRSLPRLNLKSID